MPGRVTASTAVVWRNGQRKSSVKALLRADKDNLIRLLARMHDARAELRKAIRSPRAAEASVRAAAARVAAVEADLAVERMKLFKQISPILTEDQRSKLGETQSRLDESVDRAISRASEKSGE
jgi:Spy/CpxP family protein refolding chaperone